MPLYGPEGVAIGTLCVADTEPRTLSSGQTKALAILSHQVQARMEFRSERTQLLRTLEEKRQLTVELKHSNQVLEDAKSQLEQLATTDALTGILNRRGFVERISAEFSDSVRKQRTLSLLVMDVDNFKTRNDRFGHAAGDKALCHVGKVLRKVLRSEDSAARIGGEEFAMILPETTLQQASLVVKRVQELLESWGEEDLPRVTLSVGISCLDTTAADWETLYSQSDQAMYQAKRNGKNRYAVFKAQSVA